MAEEECHHHWSTKGKEEILWRIVHGGEDNREFVFDKGKNYYDEYTGETLDVNEVEKARKHELDGYKLRGMWTTLPRFEAYEDKRWGTHPIKVRWVNSKRHIRTVQ